MNPAGHYRMGVRIVNKHCYRKIRALGLGCNLHGWTQSNDNPLCHKQIICLVIPHVDNILWFIGL